ncbi:hypothetical protein V2I80_20620 [Pseudomonas viridiflava]|uniref:hypothetical protein n=1 Tax=Pseudomonas viridiflava TaxID=33069 RepID=UPI002EB45AF1|nr:hypothetical protein [Pseudomonas viridiflava]MEE3974376.1 hypothetical protein [Pseudomonas viridiflava]MEE4019163.1 hypothetical protein [Pseudomonas viridiflava]MEE4047857.1 hypothetical protein [Pseudomonas viridiflava]
MANQDLKKLIEDAVVKIQDVGFIETFNEKLEGNKIIWTKGPCFSIIPLELQLSGLTPAKPLNGEPKNKKNVCKNYFSDDELVGVDIYNSHGELHEREIVKRGTDKVFSVRKSIKYQEIFWLEVVVLQGNKVVEACRVDSDMEHWAYSYDWQGSKIISLISLASNSVPDTLIKADYGPDESLVRLFFTVDGHEVNIYKA